MKTGIELIADERQRQITEEGWTAANDDLHANGELAAASAVYADAAEALLSGRSPEDLKHDILFKFDESRWPWDPEWLKIDTPERCLVKAGALAAAELDRLERLKQKN